MENRAYALAAGLFTMLLGFGVVAAALWFSGDAVETRDYLMVSRVPVSGLNTQAPVRYRGVTVGKVTDIKFDPDNNRQILVRISVQAATPLTKGTYAQLGSQGVTGLSYVMLDDDGSKPEPLTAEGNDLARIDVRPSFMDTVSASGQQMIDNFNQVATRVNALLNEENQKQLMTTLEHLDTATTRATALVNSIQPTLNAFPAVVEETGVVLKRADTLIANLNQRVESFERAAKSTEQLGASGSALTEAMLAESVPRLNILLEDVQRSSRGLERLLNEINDQPESLVFGRGPLTPGPGEPGFAAQRGTR
jgi:phospholipid/cholesterol/gamma-HCH transport system substrate-binding protein